MKRSLEYYLSLPYKIEILPIPENEGGGYLARLPQFGKLGIVGDGETIEEALKDLEKNKKVRFQEYLDKGFKIPEPESEVDDFSGKFILRIPRFLHRELALSAKRNGVSLNQYVCTLLAMNYQTDKLHESLSDISSELKLLNEHVGTLKYRIDKRRRPARFPVNTFRSDKYPEAA